MLTRLEDEFSAMYDFDINESACSYCGLIDNQSVAIVLEDDNPFCGRWFCNGKILL
jgi:hypothetical protein